MTDDDATRARRRRQHVKGDHSECLPGRCTALLEPAEPEFDIEVDEDLPFGLVFRSVLRSLAPMPFDDGDPKYAIAQVTLQLAATFDHAPSPALSSEIRKNLGWLMIGQGMPNDKLWEIRAKVVAGQAELLIRSAFDGLPETGRPPVRVLTAGDVPQRSAAMDALQARQA